MALKTTAVTKISSTEARKAYKTFQNVIFCSSMKLSLNYKHSSIAPRHSLYAELGWNLNWNIRRKEIHFLFGWEELEKTTSKLNIFDCHYFVVVLKKKILAW
jgi:hypothetical protein